MRKDRAMEPIRFRPGLKRPFELIYRREEAAPQQGGHAEVSHDW